MAKILIKRSSVPNKTPDLVDLDLGEIGINTTDGKMYIKKRVNSTDSLVEIGNVVDYLGYTPANRAGDTFGGTITLAANTISQIPLTFQQGVLTNTPQAHAMEWDGAFLYLTNNGFQRKKVAFTDTVSTATNAGWTIARTFSFTGDATGSMSVDGTANVSTALILANVNANVGSYGNSKNVPVVTVNAKGLVTAISTTPIALTTSDIPEGANLYYYDSRARAAISATGSLSYNSVTGVMSFTETPRSTVANTGDYNDLSNRPVIASKFTTNSTTAYQMVTTPIAQTRGVKIVVTVADTTTPAFQAQEVLIVHDGTNVYTTEYGQIMTNGNMGNIDASISSSNLVVTFTPTSPAFKVVSVTATLMLA